MRVVLNNKDGRVEPESADAGKREFRGQRKAPKGGGGGLPKT